MKFKELKEFIYSNCRVIIGLEKHWVQTHEETLFDDYEVIGIRSRAPKTNSYIEVNLKEPLFKSEPVDLGVVNEKTFGTLYQCKE